MVKTKTPEEVWNSCLQFIRDNVSLQSYKTWFEPVKAVQLDANILTVQVPSLFFYEWLEEHYVNLLSKTIKKELGPDAKLEYNIVVENSNGNRKKPSTINMPGNNAVKSDKMEVSMPGNIGSSIKNPFVIPGLKQMDVDPQLNANFTFDNFIEGECNRLARSAAMAIADNPGSTSFNPFVLYGGVGLGKTHLAQAIGNEVRRKHPGKIVLYVSAERFTNQFIDSLRNDDINDFNNFYQMIDVLLLDDVHFFSRKGKTQDIFFHIFNHLHQNDKQLVLTSDRPPSELQEFEERLVSRFKWGLSADLRVPDFETRMAILENKMFANGIKFPPDVVEYVAYNISSSIRELEGAMISLLATSSLEKKDIDLNMAKNILKSFIKYSSRELSVEQIQKMVCEHMKVEIEQIRSKVRKRPIVQARHLSMYFSKQLTNESLTRIGYKFGGRDHSTVIHACQAIDNLIDTDNSFRKTVEELKRKLEVNLG
jgi:chromosomal replication initiator protein